MLTAPLNAFTHHPAQMRTQYDSDTLAALALQIYERGLHEWQPLVASKRPGSDAEHPHYHLISGHRRHMARLFAFALRDWVVDPPDAEVTLETAVSLVHSFIEASTSLPEAVTALLDKYGMEEVSFVLFEGGEKDEILALQAANYGGEVPDMLGVAHSFYQAAEAGATVKEIARNSGQSEQYVRNHLALGNIPPLLAEHIAAGDLPLSVARTVADLPDPKRAGLTILILANLSADSSKLTAKEIKQCATTLKQWNGLQRPLVVKHQTQRNIARALVALWTQVVEAYPEDAYSAAAMLIHRHLHEEPWVKPEKLTFWFQTLGGDLYFNNGEINWTAITEHLLPELSCKSCPIAQLPSHCLQTDVDVTCRLGEASTSEQMERCLHGLTADDPFDVRVPWEWSAYPSVVHEGGEYRVKSYDDLLAAWQLQAAAEKEAAEADATAAPVDEQTAVSVAASTEPDDGDAEPATKEAQETVNTPSTVDKKTSPITKQRAQTADYMKRHEQFSVSHPFATSCGSCRHRLTASPTKDESVPHCAWAGRSRKTAFNLLVSTEKAAPQIPVCRQYAPEAGWSELIPAHPNVPETSRDWLKAQILHLVTAANRHGSNRNAFEFLTGRPMSSSESYGDWFKNQLAAQEGELSLEQMYTLFVWAHSEWRRPRGGLFTLPVNGNGAQFASYKEVAWQVAS